MGPGLQPPLQVISSTAVQQSNAGSWRRYACWGFDKSLRAEHSRYGLMLNFCELSEGGGTVTFSTSSLAYDRAKTIQKVRVLVGNTESAFVGRLTAGGKSYGEKRIEAGRQVQLIEWELDTFPKTLTLSFSGGGTPEIYGIALDGKSGVSVDNMPMRGCSGTIFTRVDSTVLKQSYDLMNVKLIIMEFGGNMMPSIAGEKNAKDYGERFLEQIRYLRRIKPDAAILVIGLADMSKKIDGKMQSYPYITNVRDALKKATFDAGGTYWDMLEVMGGTNSMPSWVDQGLAGKDYIHFTTKGAQRVSEMFYDALINDYNEYRLQKRIDQINAKD
jgi:lysophospholipase L1-like esterase